MKNLPLIITLVLSTLLFSCTEKDSGPVLTKVNASTLNNLPYESVKLVATDADKNPLMCTFTWTETSFFFNNSEYRSASGPVSYTLEMDQVGNNFASPYNVASTESLYTNILTADMIAILQDNYNTVLDQEMNMEFRIRAVYGQSDTMYSSNNVRLTITITTDSNIPEPTYVQTMYLIGSMNGWNNSNTDFMMFRNNSDYTTGEFTYTGRLAADSYYKFISEDNLGTWNLYYTTTGTDMVLGQSDGGAWYNQTEGYYTITINVINMTYSVTPYDITTAAPYVHATFPYPTTDHTFNTVGVIGQFCGWANEPALTRSSYDPHIWYVKEIALSDVTYGIKFRAENSWDMKWSPDVTTDVPYGVASYNSTTQDNNIDVTGYGAGTYTIMLNDLTGQYVTKFLRK